MCLRRKFVKLCREVPGHHNICLKAILGKVSRIERNDKISLTLFGT